MNHKRLYNGPSFYRAYTPLMYELHALKKSDLLFKRLRYFSNFIKSF